MGNDSRLRIPGSPMYPDKLARDFQKTSMEKQASHISSQAHRLIFSPYDSLDAAERRVVKSMTTLYVTLLRSFIAASYVTLGCLVMLKPKMSTTVYFLWAWGLAEVALHVFMLLRTRFVLDKILPFARPCHEDGLALTEEICRSELSLEEVFGSWQPVGEFDLARFNTWLVFYWFYKLPEHLTEQEKKELTQVQKKIEEVYSIKLRNLPFAKEAGIRPLIEPVPFRCKPLLVYLMATCVDLASDLALKTMKFKRKQIPGNPVTYWQFTGTSSEPPIFVMHGLGIGWLMYMMEVRSIRRTHPTRTVILLNLPMLTITMLAYMVTMDQIIAAIDHICLPLGPCSFVTHSYSTLIGGWLSRDRPQLIHKMVMLDPICFQTWKSTLPTNFVYASPTSCIHEVARYLLGHDPNITHLLFRNFHWFQNSVFARHFTRPTHIYLAMRDWIVDSETFHTHLMEGNNPNLKVTKFDHHHGDILLSPELAKSVWETL